MIPLDFGQGYGSLWPMNDDKPSSATVAAEKQPDGASRPVARKRSLRHESLDDKASSVDNAMRCNDAPRYVMKRALRHESLEQKTARLLRQCPDGYMTRAILCDRTGISAAELTIFEKRGFVKCAMKDSRGWRLYAESAVQAVRNVPISAFDREAKYYGAASRQGTDPPFTAREAAAVFKLLDEGKNVKEISQILETHPVVIKSIFKDWLSLTKQIVMTRTDLDIINGLPLQGTFPIRTNTMLVKLLQNAAKERKCRDCKVRDQYFLCAPCFTARLEPGTKTELRALIQKLQDQLDSLESKEQQLLKLKEAKQREALKKRRDNTIKRRDEDGLTIEIGDEEHP